MKATEYRRLRIAIIGAGPSGIYAAEALLKGLQEVSIDLFERLPTPYGLVRYGVAPDHQKIKSVTRLYQKTCGDERLRFLGNVEFGKDLLHDDVKKHYHAVIYAVGSPLDRSLGIPGEDLPGSMSATEFVAWYNGHPDFADENIRLEAEAVAVIGLGNVAVDVTRILAKSVAELRTTDISDRALEVLEESRVQDIYMLGRRGPAQAKFTTKELRELGELENADIIVDPSELELDRESLAAIENNPSARKNLEILQDFSKRLPTGKARRIHLRFLVSPKELRGKEAVETIVLERNRLEVREGGYLAAVGSGSYQELPVQLVLRSVGYRGTPLPGVPFDHRRNLIPNDAGRVLREPGGSPLPGEYVAGWIKRGPTGVIGTNKADAKETVTSLLADELPPVDADDADPRAILELLAARGVRVVGFDGWLAIDRCEVETGQKQGRPRVKITDIEALLACADTRPG